MFVYFEICDFVLFSSRSTVKFSYLSSNLSLSQCQWVAVRLAAVTITFLVVAERSIGCRRTQLWPNCQQKALFLLFIAGHFLI